jgi:hypothetical protein
MVEIYSMIAQKLNSTVQIIKKIYN